MKVRLSYNKSLKYHHSALIIINLVTFFSYFLLLLFASFDIIDLLLTLKTLFCQIIFCHSGFLTALSIPFPTSVSMYRRFQWVLFSAFFPMYLPAPPQTIPFKTLAPVLTLCRQFANLSNFELFSLSCKFVAAY